MSGTVARNRAIGAGLAMFGVFALAGCGLFGGDELKSDEAREQLMTAVEAIQSATGENWEVDAEPGLLGCSKTYSQWHTSWDGSPTADRETSYADVRRALEEAGFTTHIWGADTKTPVVSSQTGDGFGLDFSMPVEGGPIRFNASSDCFLEEE